MALVAIVAVVLTVVMINDPITKEQFHQKNQAVVIAGAIDEVPVIVAVVIIIAAVMILPVIICIIDDHHPNKIDPLNHGTMTREIQHSKEKTIQITNIVKKVVDQGVEATPPTAMIVKVHILATVVQVVRVASDQSPVKAKKRKQGSLLLMMVMIIVVAGNDLPKIIIQISNVPKVIMKQKSK